MPLPPQPTNPIPEYRYHAEWVWIIANYDAQLDKLARALTDKYRTPLKIPAGAYLDAQQWMSTSDHVQLDDVRQEVAGMSIVGPLVIPQSICLSAGRAEFGARKTDLDNALAQAFANWNTATRAKTPAAVVLLWQTATDLRQFRDAIHNKNLFSRFNVHDKMSDLAAKNVAKLTSDLVEYLLDVPERHWARALLDKKTLEYLTKKGTDYAIDEPIKEEMGKRIKAVFNRPNEKALEDMAVLLIKAADAQLDDVAFPRPRIAGDYRRLGGADGFATGLALKMAPDIGLARRWKAKTIDFQVPAAPDTPGLTTNLPVQLGPWQMARLEQGHTLSYTTNYPGGQQTFTVTAKDIPDYDHLLKTFKADRANIAREGEAGEKLWFQRLQSPEKIQVLAALRLASQDLRQIIEEDWLTPKAKDKAVELYSDALTTAGPGWLAPFKGAVKSLVSGGVNWAFPNQREQFLQQLDRLSLALVPEIAQPAPVQAIFPDRNMDKLVLRIDSRLPQSCGGGEYAEVWLTLSKGPIPGIWEYGELNDFLPILKIKLRNSDGAIIGNCDHSLQNLGILEHLVVQVQGRCDPRTGQVDLNVSGRYDRDSSYQRGQEGTTEVLQGHLIGWRSSTNNSSNINDLLGYGAGRSDLAHPTANLGQMTNTFSYFHNKLPPSVAQGRSPADAAQMLKPQTRQVPFDEWRLVALVKNPGGESAASRPMKGQWNSSYGTFILDQLGSQVEGTIRYPNGYIGTVRGIGSDTLLDFKWYDGQQTCTARLTRTANGTYSGAYYQGIAVSGKQPLGTLTIQKGAGQPAGTNTGLAGSNPNLRQGNAAGRNTTPGAMGANNGQNLGGTPPGGVTTPQSLSNVPAPASPPVPSNSASPPPTNNTAAPPPGVTPRSTPPQGNAQAPSNNPRSGNRPPQRQPAGTKKPNRQPPP